MRFLIIDKQQRVKIKNKYPFAITRIIEELDKKNAKYSFAYNHQIEFKMIDGKVTILADGNDIRDYTHIILRGHFLDQHMQYEMKNMIIEYIDEYNSNNPDKKILVQNANAMRNFPYYNKISTALLCSKHDIPYFDTYFRTDGDYKNNLGDISYPLIVKEYTGVNDLRMIDDKEKVKKNVYKVDDIKGFDQEYLNNKNMKNFFLQEFAPIGEDIRTFVSNKKVIGGWKRKATKGFMTVSKGEYTMYDLETDPRVTQLAEKFASIINADFMAVDFMYIDDKPYLQEISFHPGFKAYETKIDGKPANIAEAIINSFKN